MAQITASRSSVLRDLLVSANDEVYQVLRRDSDGNAIFKALLAARTAAALQQAEGRFWTWLHAHPGLREQWERTATTLRRRRRVYKMKGWYTMIGACVGIGELGRRNTRSAYDSYNNGLPGTSV